eukprot:403334824
MESLTQQLTLGILRETTTPWERRVPFTPETVKKFADSNIKVLIQASSNRCFSDAQYESAGAIISEDLSSCNVICGIKPAKRETLISGKTYMMYTRVHTGAKLIAPYFKDLIEKKITLIDYEKIRGEKNEILVGSSKLAGTVGMFNVFRVIGEMMLLRENINTPFLFTGGSAYMHRDKHSCEKALQNVQQMINDQGGLHKSISPFIIGILGSGIVANGAIELISQNMNTQEIDVKDIHNLVSNPPEDAKFKIYYTLISRMHYLKLKTDHHAQIDSSLLESNPELYESVLNENILPNLTILVNCANWTQGSPKILTNEQIRISSQKPQFRLKAISDIAALVNGPIEFFKEECKIERPYFLYDCENSKSYETHDELQKIPSECRSNKIIGYLGVEQLPAELSKDASDMFSSALEQYVPQILQASRSCQDQGLRFEDAFQHIPKEIMVSIATTNEGKTGPHYDYLNYSNFQIMEDVQMRDTTTVLKNGKSNDEKDLYMKMKELESELEILQIQEDYLKDEQRHLKSEYVRSKEEIKRIQSVYLGTGNFVEMIDEAYGIVGSTSGSQFYVRVLSTLNREELKPNARVALHRSSHSVVDILPPDTDAAVQMMKMTEKPDVTYNDVGGLDIQKQEIREAIELPLIQPELYSQIGIDPPRGVLLYGPPGTGKTMLAKAVASQTNAAFIRMVGSEFVQKYLGEGPRMVRDVFRLARENAPSIVFIDEIDSIATKRFDANTGADREVQRILIELLQQMDGFDQQTNVKVIMATNRADTLDPALLRPGRLDRKIEFPLPDRRQKRLVFQTLTSKMNLKT